MFEGIRKSRFLRDSFILQSSGMLVAASQLLSSVLLAHALGERGQGLFVSALKIYGLYFMLFNAGVAAATVTQIGAAVTRQQKDKIAAWQAFTLKAYGLAGLLLFAAGWWILPPLSERFFHNRELGVWAWWLTLCPVLELGRVLAMTSFQGMRKMAYLARLDVGTELARLCLIAFAALYFKTPQAAVIATIGSCALGSLWGLFLYRAASRGEAQDDMPKLGYILEQIRAVPLRVGLRLGMRLGFLRSLDSMANDLLPPLFLLFAGVQLGMADAEGWVAYMNIAQKIMLLPVVLLSGIARTALPTLSGVAGRKDPEAFKRGFFRISMLGGAITFTGLVVALLVLPFAVRLVYPSSYVEPVALLASILAIGFTLKGFCGAFDSFYIVADRLRVAMLFSGISMLVAMPIMLYLTWQFPRTGAAWGVNVIHSVVLLHYVYMIWFFKTGKHKRLFGLGTAVTQAS